MANDLFAGGEPPISQHEKIRELTHEISMRDQVYGRQVKAGKMSETTMKRKIAIMESILADYKEGRVRDA